MSDNAFEGYPKKKSLETIEEFVMEHVGVKIRGMLLVEAVDHIAEAVRKSNELYSQLKQSEQDWRRRAYEGFEH